MKVLGQDLEVISAVVANIVSWVVKSFFPRLLPKLLPPISQEHDSTTPPSPQQTRCVAIGRPGGREQLRVITLKPNMVTVGYNMGNVGSFLDLTATSAIPAGSVLVRVEAFSVNFADCAIRWGLYESANKFVGWPICPGFDVAGVVEKVYPGSTNDSSRQAAVGDNDSDDADAGADGGHGEGHGEARQFKIGQKVFGATFFGAYSTRVLVPAAQLRAIPSGMSPTQAAALPSVALTALYTLHLGGQYPIHDVRPSNRAVLVHSAAGGVGGMIVQMAKILGLGPVVGVVGRTSKVEAARTLGCDVVIDKSQEDLWSAAAGAVPNGFILVADSSGVATLQQSYDHLAPTGRLITFGFHTNLPMGKDMLSPTEWIKMASKMSRMPKFEPMDLTTQNKSVLGFNLSFFVDEIDMLGHLYDQISAWLDDGKLSCPRIVEMEMSCIGDAHDLLHSGTTIGKIVVTTK